MATGNDQLATGKLEIPNSKIPISYFQFAGIPISNFYYLSIMTNSPLLGTEADPGYAPTSDERTMAILSHVLCFVVGLLAPLIIYLVKKDESQYVAAHAKESLNFQITFWIFFVVFFILIVVYIGILLLWLEGIVATILIIVATVRASEGKLYRYPFSIRLIK